MHRGLATMSLCMHKGLMTMHISLSFFQFFEKFRCDAMTDIMLDVLVGKKKCWNAKKVSMN